MNGQAKEEDPEFDDDFVLEGVDELELDDPPEAAAAQADAPDAADPTDARAAADAADPDAGNPDAGDAGAVGDGEPKDSDDILFEVPKGPLRRELSGAQFRESGGRQWGGAEMSAEEIGIPLGGQAQSPEDAFAETAGVQEVELEADVDELGGDTGGDEVEIGATEEGESFGTAVGEGGEEPFVVVDGDGSEVAEEPVPEEWAPPVEEEEVVAEAAPEPEAAEEELEPVSEYQEIDAASRGGTVLTPVSRRGALVRRLAALAALVLVAGAGVLVWQPEWLGIGGEEPVVERTPIARPDPGLDVKPPELPVKDPVRDPTPDPTRDPAPDPDPLPDPRGGDPRPDPTPDPMPDPTPAGDPQHDPAGGDPRVADPALRPLTEIRLGDELRIGERVAGATEAPALPPIAQGMVLGTQALAQLHNGNFFLGTVKAIEPAAMTLRLEKGEVVIDYGEIAQLSAIGSQEYQELKKAEKGYVRLNNQNRLVGNILKVGLSDHVILEMKQSRVVIPRAAIEEIGSTVHTGVKLTDDENDEWVRKLVERTLQGEAPPAESPAPVPEKK